MPTFGQATRKYTPKRLSDLFDTAWHQRSFFLIISKDVNEAIVNSLALFFILEMDDVLKPKWGDADFDDRFAQSSFRCIDGGGVEVEIISSEGIADAIVNYSNLLFHSDDRAHVILTEDVDKLLVTVYWDERKNSYSFVDRLVQFQISGKNGKNLFDNIKGFHCVQSDKLANIDLGVLMNSIQSHLLATADQDRQVKKFLSRLERQNNATEHLLRWLERDRLKRQREDELDRIMTEVRSYIALEAGARVLTPILPSDNPYCK